MAMAIGKSQGAKRDLNTLEAKARRVVYVYKYIDIYVYRFKYIFIEFGFKAKPSVLYVGFLTLAALRDDDNNHDWQIYYYIGGIIIDAAESPMRECISRASAAMSSYCPIATKVFGSTKISRNHKLCFVVSLIWSQLFFNVHVLVMTPKALAKLNSVYMCVL